MNNIIKEKNWETMKEYGNNFAIWVSKLSWGGFLIFAILTSIGSGIVQDILMPGYDDNFLKHLTALFIFSSLVIKVVINSKVKSDIKAQEAQLCAEKESLRRQLAESTVKLLQAQIEPHFLFNTLSSVQFLMETDPKKANEMLSNLTSYLRYALPQIREDSPYKTLGHELENIKAYLNIMQIRMGERLVVKYEVSDLLMSLPMPSMMLQPIVENAIKYGIEESMDGGVITIAAHYIDNCLEVIVADTGAGINPNKPGGNGMALHNIKSRLEMLYGDNASLSIISNSPQGVIVKLKLPAK